MGRPYIFNKTLTDANTEYEVDLGAFNVDKLLLQFDSTQAGRLSFDKGGVAASTRPYFDLKASTATEFNCGGAPLKIYVASGSAGAILEGIATVG